MKTALLVIFVTLVACSPQKRLNRLIDNHPELSQTDTVTVRDTFVIEAIRHDTVLHLDSLQDTVYIQKDRLKIKTVIRDNKIFIEGECETDTIFTEILVPVEKLIYVQDTFWTDVKKKFKKYWWWLIVATVLIIAGRFAKKIIP